MLFTDVRSTEPDKLTGTLVHSLAHLYFRSPYAWLQEGVASFMGSLWLEQNRGRDVAIQQLDNTRGALSLAEPAMLRSGDRSRQRAPDFADRQRPGVLPHQGDLCFLDVARPGRG